MTTSQNTTPQIMNTTNETTSTNSHENDTITPTKCVGSFRKLFELFDSYDYSTDKMTRILFDLMKKYNDFTEDQKLDLRCIAKKFGHESFNVMCIITNNVELLQKQSHGFYDKVSVPLSIVEAAFLYQKPEMLKLLIDIGWKFEISDCFYMMDNQHHNVELETSIVRDFFFDTFAPTSRKTSNVLVSSLSPKRNEKSPIENQWERALNDFHDHYGFAFTRHVCISTFFDHPTITKRQSTKIQKIKEWFDKYEFLKPA